MVSAVVLTKNEELNIEKCLLSLNWCDERIVVDDNSNDKTVELATKNGARVYKHSLNNNFSKQRNFALSKSKGDWVLFVDADEVVGNNLKKEILKKVKAKDVAGYYVTRQDYFLGKKMEGGEWGKSLILRLGKKSAGKWTRGVHERWEIDGKTAVLRATLLHYHEKGLKDFVRKINLYSVLHSESNNSEGKNASFVKIVFMPTAKFIYNFIVKKGYKDGTHGFVYSIMMSFHSFLSWSQLWIISKNHPKT